MRHYSLLPLTALTLWFIPAIVPAADNADASRIAKLVAQLGNDDFREREKASAALDVLGEPALDALRQAMKSTDEELRKRAETLVGKIEKRLDTAAALKAKRVHLAYKNAVLNEALVDFEKQSGYHFALNDPENKLKSRTITLDTGDAPFWQAFDQFCDKAGLKEAEDQELMPVPDGNIRRLPVLFNCIALADGKTESRTTDAASAVRICVLAKTGHADAPQTGDVPFTLHLSLEPRLQWVSVENVRITKAVDDRKQELTQAADPLPAAPGVIFAGGGVVPATTSVYPGAGSIHQDAIFRLKEGERYSTSLTELTGMISASILTEAAPVITAPDVLKAAGKTFKGGNNGQLKVIEATKDEDGRITLRVALQPPSDAIPAGGMMGRGALRRLGRGVPIAVPPGGVLAVRGSVFIGGGGSSAGGLSLLDDKGEAVRLTNVQLQFTPVVAGGAGIVNQLQHVLTFQAAKGQEPVKLVYSGRKVLNLEMPFTLKDVPLP